jgi:hypothetical protein
MTGTDRFLDDIEVATPCPAAWEQMMGDERVRHCAECKLNVYNLSEMTRSEATQLVQQTENRLCVRFLRREDGTVITRDCPVGLAAVRRGVRLARARVIALVSLMITGLFGCNRRTTADPQQDPQITPLQGEAMIMGDVLEPMPAHWLGRMLPVNQSEQIPQEDPQLEPPASKDRPAEIKK